MPDVQFFVILFSQMVFHWGCNQAKYCLEYVTFVEFTYYEKQLYGTPILAAMVFNQ